MDVSGVRWLWDAEHEAQAFAHMVGECKLSREDALETILMTEAQRDWLIIHDTVNGARHHSQYVLRRETAKQLERLLRLQP